MKIRISIKKIIRKFFFCCTQCVCLRRYLHRTCYLREEYMNEEDTDEDTIDRRKHPIYDLEKGELSKE